MIYHATFPYLFCCCFFRIAPVVPLAAPHKALCDTTLAGHRIPKGTEVWPNLWGLQHKEELWGDPEVFRPERYLDDDGDLVRADHPARVCMLTFSAGPRVCAGETFAMTRMFLLLAQMMKAFEVMSPEGQKPLHIHDLVSGDVLMAPPYQMILKLRN